MSQADRMFDVLDDLACALRQGDFPAFAGLSDRIAAELDALEDEVPPEPVLVALGARAAQIATLLEAAASGLAAARRRVAEIESVRQGLATYAGDGRRRVLAPPPPPPQRF